MDDKQSNKPEWVKEIEVAGAELVDFVKKLAAEGQAKRVRILEPDGDIAVDVPLTVGAIAGGAVVLAAPVLAVLGALAAFYAKVRIEIVADVDADMAKAAEKDKKAPETEDA